MNTEDLFKFGVTPKKGELAGKRFAVGAIKPDGLDVYKWGNEGTSAFFKHGEYDIWKEPKTLFEDDSIAPTWGNLKKAMEKAGLSDDTHFKVPVGFWIDYGCKDANVKVISVNGKDAVYFY